MRDSFIIRGESPRETSVKVHSSLLGRATLITRSIGDALENPEIHVSRGYLATSSISPGGETTRSELSPSSAEFFSRSSFSLGLSAGLALGQA